MSPTGAWRKDEFGRRPARIANCSGYHGDSAEEMYKQASLGDVDFITGDYLAEVNMADNAEAHTEGRHSGYEESAWLGLQQAIDLIYTKRIKVAINGGALNPEGLAMKIAETIKLKGYDLKVAFVSGDNVLPQISKNMPTSGERALPHLDSSSYGDSKDFEHLTFYRDHGEPLPIVSANAYLGARAILKGFQEDADIVICGRVSDASPVIAAAWYWWSWSDEEYDRLAGALIAGHLIECSAYATGGNFSGFDQYDVSDFLDPGFPIAEISQDGSCVITKHPGTGGMVNVDTCKSQLLYELQGNVYLHSDVKAYLNDVAIEQVGKDRVHVHGIRGSPPPPTTKLAIFYKGGYEVQILANATGYAADEKFDLYKRQIYHFMDDELLSRYDVLDIQSVGVPALNPKTQNTSTVYFRIFAQATDTKALTDLSLLFRRMGLKHFSGEARVCVQALMASISDKAKAFTVFATNEKLAESVHFVNDHEEISSHQIGHSPTFEVPAQRDSYDTVHPRSFPGPTKKIRLGDIAQGRSGDKGSNLNCGIFVDTNDRWDWLRTYLSCGRVTELLGEDMSPAFKIERVEFPNIFAVHFVIYGILERGVGSSSRLDGFGKGFVDYFRDKIVDCPESLL